MRTRISALIGIGLFAMLPMMSQANTVVAGYGIPPVSGSCTWQLTSSSGGGGAPQFYTLHCGATLNVVGMMTVGGSCNTTASPKPGYLLQGSGCSTTVVRISSVPPQPAQCTSANKGKTYFSGPTYIANSIMQTSSASVSNFCGDCKVLVSGSSNGYSTISCSLYP